METISNFVNDVIARKNKSITDEVFLLIQNNREFMQRYFRLIEKEGLDNINRRIGKLIKEKYNLKNDEQRNNEPLSTLISSHQEFE